MKIIVIGLGYYGKSVAVRLAEAGHEVICVDNRMGNIESIKDSVSAAFVFDSTDMLALSSIPVAEADLCIVTIGEDLGASVRTVALLKKLGAAKIYVRASDPVHRSVVDAFNVDRIIMPEDDSARDFVAQLQLNSEVRIMGVAKGAGVFRFHVPACIAGRTLKEAALPEKYGLSVITVLRADKSVNDVGIQTSGFVPDDNFKEDAVLDSADVLVCYGSEKGYFKLVSSKA